MVVRQIHVPIREIAAAISGRQQLARDARLPFGEMDVAVRVLRGGQRRRQAGCTAADHQYFHARSSLFSMFIICHIPPHDKCILDRRARKRYDVVIAAADRRRPIGGNIMKKRWIALLLAAVLPIGVLAGCGSEDMPELSLDKKEYTVIFPVTT